MLTIVSLELMNHQKIKLLALIPLLFFMAFQSQAQVAGILELKGTIRDHKGEGLAFATVFVKEQNTGTTTNELGAYSIKLLPGSYEISFQYVGYKTQTLEISMYSSRVLDIDLEPESLILDDVVIEATDQDPAYRIIREAQAKRRYYLREEIKSYQTQVYIKGLQRLNERPKSFLGVAINVDTGIVYFSESLSKLEYMQPDKYREEMISSKVSGDSRAFSFNQANNAWLNLYENVSAQEISERGVISPIAANALSYYRYRLEGAYQDRGQWVNKIRLIPRRKNAPAYGGYIYIMEDTWRIHSAELSLRSGVVEFVDSVSVRQVYAPDPEFDIWLPLNQSVNFEISAFGFKGKGYFLFNYFDYTVNPNFDKKNFKGPIIKVLPDANQKDESYWQAIRPLPLTKEETTEYRSKDSLEVLKKSQTYLDSIDRKQNRLKIGSFLWAGVTRRNSFKKSSFRLPGLIQMVQFNTVEGWVLNLPIQYQKELADKKVFAIRPALRYGLADERFHAKLGLDYTFNPLKLGRIRVEAGRFVEPISRQYYIRPWINTAYSLLDERNFLKLYQKTFVRMGLRHDVHPKVLLNTSWEYARRRSRVNASEYSLRDVSNREYTPNAPQSVVLEDTRFPTHNALVYDIGLTFLFKMSYAEYPQQKIILDLPFPRLAINYRGGLPVLGSDISFGLLSARVYDQLNVGLLGDFRFQIEGGLFTHRDSLSFVDFQHFPGNRTLFARNDYRSYQLLDYYLYSTQRSYVSAYVEQHFNGFLWNSLPLLKKLKWQIVAGGSYLYTPELGHYGELSIGIEHILKILRVSYVQALPDGRPLQRGVRLGFGF